mmetsp:Transcript_48543/g.96777  ORF Transcript_48543/g.96777 Transcript_48543/m.96777 type:complete len:101 (+) Transcript_48543:241-543(+)
MRNEMRLRSTLTNSVTAAFTAMTSLPRHRHSVDRDVENLARAHAGRDCSSDDSATGRMRHPHLDDITWWAVARTAHFNAIAVVLILILGGKGSDDRGGEV